MRLQRRLYNVSKERGWKPVGWHIERIVSPTMVEIIVKLENTKEVILKEISWFYSLDTGYLKDGRSSR